MSDTPLITLDFDAIVERYGTGPYYTDEGGVISIIGNVESITNPARLLPSDVGEERWAAQQADYEAALAEAQEARADSDAAAGEAAAGRYAARLDAVGEIAEVTGVPVDTWLLALGLN